jgi:hypothetical protein
MDNTPDVALAIKTDVRSHVNLMSPRCLSACNPIETGRGRIRWEPCDRIGEAFWEIASGQRNHEGKAKMTSPMASTRKTVLKAVRLGGA